MDSETPFRDLSGDGVTRSGRVGRIVVGGCPINPGKNVVAIHVDGMDKGKTKKEAYDACVSYRIRFVLSRSGAGLRESETCDSPTKRSAVENPMFVRLYKLIPGILNSEIDSVVFSMSI